MLGFVKSEHPRLTNHEIIFLCDSVVTTLHVETEAKTEAAGIETEAEAQGSWSIFFSRPY